MLGHCVRDAATACQCPSRDCLRDRLRDIEELSTQEVAEALDLTPSAVKVRLHRARQALLTLLRPHVQRGPTR